MSREFTRVLIGTAISLVLILIIVSLDGDQYAVIGFAILTLILDLVMLLIGIVLVMMKRTRKWGKAMLLASGLLLLTSFTLCTALAV